MGKCGVEGCSNERGGATFGALGVYRNGDVRIVVDGKEYAISPEQAEDVGLLFVRFAAIGMQLKAGTLTAVSEPLPKPGGWENPEPTVIRSGKVQ